MKIENNSDRSLLIKTENPQEANEMKAFRAEVINLLPILQEQWEKDLVVLSKLSDLPELNDKHVFFPKKYSIYNTGTPLAVRLKRASGRPMDKRTLLANLRLLLGAPKEKVLAQEKEWRISEYCKKVRDKSVISAKKKARNRAIRDADMCLKRANDSVWEYFIQHPDRFVKFAIFQAVVREELGTDAE